VVIPFNIFRMILFKHADSLQNRLKKFMNSGKNIGFVPTMGALHDGHLSLIKKCKLHSDITVSSIFVNPTQFNDKKDFEKYPITISDDILKLEQNGCDILFIPSVNEIYPDGTTLHEQYDLGFLEKIFEGAHRPGHFQGVCQVVDRLLNIVQPDTLFLGQKDFQQCKVIERLIHLIQLPVKLNIGETQREASGLAMSSRNLRLSDSDKQKASGIYQTLLSIKNKYKKKTFEQITQESTHHLLSMGFAKVDYVSIADADTLTPVEDYDESKKYIALIAASIGQVRLIDNMLLN
jgi:pantoate--beta-alanine ligase